MPFLLGDERDVSAGRAIDLILFILHSSRVPACRVGQLVLEIGTLIRIGALPPWLPERIAITIHTAEGGASISAIPSDTTPGLRDKQSAEQAAGRG